MLSKISKTLFENKHSFKFTHYSFTIANSNYLSFTLEASCLSRDRFTVLSLDPLFIEVLRIILGVRVLNVLDIRILNLFLLGFLEA